MRRWLWLSALFLIAATSTPTYVRARDDSDNSHCLWWQAGSIQYSQSAAGDSSVVNPTQAVTSSWQTWQTQFANCGNLTLSETPQSASRTVGYDQSGGANTNLILFRMQLCSSIVPSGDACLQDSSCGNTYDCWSESYAEGILALTTTTYDTRTGQLYDSDTEINAASFYFTTVDSPVCPVGVKSQSCVVYDVQNTMTHEFGHSLGLAHSSAPDSTMFASAPVGETSKRVLDSSSAQFVCDAYPKGAPSKDCSSSSPSGTGTNGGGCTSAPWTAASLLALMAWAWPRRGQPG